MNTTTAPTNAVRPPADEPQHILQAVSLQDYEQVVTARASFLDFLLSRTDEGE